MEKKLYKLQNIIMILYRFLIHSNKFLGIKQRDYGEFCFLAIHFEHKKTNVDLMSRISTLDTYYLLYSHSYVVWHIS